MVPPDPAAAASDSIEITADDSIEIRWRPKDS